MIVTPPHVSDHSTSPCHEPPSQVTSEETVGAGGGGDEVGGDFGCGIAGIGDGGAGGERAAGGGGSSGHVSHVTGQLSIWPYVVL